MPVLDVRWRRVALWTCLLLTAGIALGLVHPVARVAASCAGPQLDLRQSGAPVRPQRVGEGSAEKVIYRIDRTARLAVHGSNLTFDCLDTVGSGCSTSPTRDDTIRPLRDVELIFEQNHRQWQLATIGDIGRDLEADVVVDLPARARPGAAILRLLDPHQDGGAQLDLIIA